MNSENQTFSAYHNLKESIKENYKKTFNRPLISESSLCKIQEKSESSISTKNKINAHFESNLINIEIKTPLSTLNSLKTNNRKIAELSTLQSNNVDENGIFDNFRKVLSKSRLSKESDNFNFSTEHFEKSFLMNNNNDNSENYTIFLETKDKKTCKYKHRNIYFLRKLRRLEIRNSKLRKLNQILNLKLFYEKKLNSSNNIL